MQWKYVRLNDSKRTNSCFQWASDNFTTSIAVSLHNKQKSKIKFPYFHLMLHLFNLLIKSIASLAERSVRFEMWIMIFLRELVSTVIAEVCFSFALWTLTRHKVAALLSYAWHTTGGTIYYFVLIFVLFKSKFKYLRL